MGMGNPIKWGNLHLIGQWTNAHIACESLWKFHRESIYLHMYT